MLTKDAAAAAGILKLNIKNWFALFLFKFAVLTFTNSSCHVQLLLNLPLLVNLPLANN